MISRWLWANYGIDNGGTIPTSRWVGGLSGGGKQTIKAVRLRPQGIFLASATQQWGGQLFGSGFNSRNANRSRSAITYPLIPCYQGRRGTWHDSLSREGILQPPFHSFDPLWRPHHHTIVRAPSALKPPSTVILQKYPEDELKNTPCRGDDMSPLGIA